MSRNCKERIWVPQGVYSLDGCLVSIEGNRIVLLADLRIHYGEITHANPLAKGFAITYTRLGRIVDGQVRRKEHEADLLKL